MVELLSATELLQRYQAGDRNFRHYHLAGLDLREADLRQADFSRAELQGADFGYADLRAAAFVGADLSGANFQGAIVAETDFTAANLSGARGLDRGIAEATIDNVAGDRTIATTGKRQPTNSGRAGQPRAATAVSAGAAAVTSLLDTGGSDSYRDRSAELLLTSQEAQDLVRRVQALQRWRGVTTTMALILLFVAVLGGYLGYVKYREYEQLEDRVAEREQEWESQLEELSTELDFLRQERQNLKARESQYEELSAELDLLRQERQNLATELENERELGANNASQVTTLLERLHETETQLEAERERVEQLGEINQLLQERLGGQDLESQTLEESRTPRSLPTVPNLVPNP